MVFLVCKGRDAGYRVSVCLRQPRTTTWEVGRTYLFGERLPGLSRPSSAPSATRTIRATVFIPGVGGMLAGVEQMKRAPHGDRGTMEGKDPHEPVFADTEPLAPQCVVLVHQNSGHVEVVQREASLNRLYHVGVSEQATCEKTSIVSSPDRNAVCRLCSWLWRRPSYSTRRTS